MRHTAYLLLLTEAFTPLAVASDEDDLTSLSYISYLERYATVQPASQEESLEAIINLPLVPGDRTDTARQARMEAQLSDGAVLWLDEYTSLSFDAIAFSRDTQGDRTVLFLAEGGIAVEIPEHSLSTTPTRVDSTSATAYLEPDGLYRLQRLENGGLRVEVWHGLAEAATADGGIPVRAGSAVEISAGQVDRSEEIMTQGDEFGQWVAQRRYELQGDSDLHLEDRFQQEGEILDSYGSWVYVDNNESWAWRPQVATSWSPYTSGRWYWTSVGWSWVSYEPWGWLPYHYGSWYNDPVYGWVWYWNSYWGPSWVSWISWGGYIGWCPRGYYDYWWYSRWCCDYWWYPPGNSDPRPPAGDTRPPRSVQGISRNEIVGGGQGDPIGPSDFALDSSGIVKAEKLDGTGWNLVPASDFASPHLPRLIENGQQVLRGAEGMGDAVVLSGPLVTPSPSVSRTTDLLEQRFDQAARTNPADVTPIFARDTSLRPEQGSGVVRPTTTSGLTRTITRESNASPAQDAAPRNAGGSSGITQIPSRYEAPNIHRPVLRSGGGSTAAGTPSRPTITSPTVRRSPQSSSSGSVRPSGQPSSTRSVPGASTRTPSRESSSYSPRKPSASSSSTRPSIYPRSPSTSSPSSRSATPQRGYSSPTPRTAPSSSRSSRPVIVPRSTRSSSASPSASSYSRRPSATVPSRSSTRSAPSSRSVTRPSSGSSSSSRPSASRSSSSSAPRSSSPPSSSSRSVSRPKK